MTRTRLQKQLVRQMTHLAMQLGDLAKGPCEVCGDLNVHAHHTDYTNHLAVRWLCPTHHREAHQADGTAGRPPRAGEVAARRFEIRCTSEELAAWRAAASSAGMTVSEWIRSLTVGFV